MSRRRPSSRLRSAAPAVVLMTVAVLVCAAAAPAAAWRQFGRTATHSNEAPGEDAFTVDDVGGLAVEATAHFGAFASSEGGAAVVDGVAYVGGSKGVLSAFDVDGCDGGHCARLWRGVADNGMYGTPAVAGGLVLIGSADHHLYAFDADGCGSDVCDPVWRGQLRDGALASVAVADGRAYLGDFSGNIYAFAVRGCGKPLCRPLWTGHGGKHLEFNTNPAVSDGHVVIGALFNTPDDASGRLLSFATAGCGYPVCTPEWTADLLGQANGNLSPLIDGDTVFMGSGTRFSDEPNTSQHLFAFALAGCGQPRCAPLWSYETGTEDLTGGLALSDGVIYAGSQSTPDPNTIGVFSAFDAAGCGDPVCDPMWTAVNFAAGFESPPVVAGGVVFVAKGPASGFPVDEAVLAYPAAGCGEATCQSLAFVQTGTQQFYLGSPIAVSDHRLYVPTEASVGGRDDLVVLGLPAP